MCDYFESIYSSLKRPLSHKLEKFVTASKGFFSPFLFTFFYSCCLFHFKLLPFLLKFHFFCWIPFKIFYFIIQSCQFFSIMIWYICIIFVKHDLIFFKMGKGMSNQILWTAFTTSRSKIHTASVLLYFSYRSMTQFSWLS